MTIRESVGGAREALSQKLYDKRSEAEAMAVMQF